MLDLVANRYNCLVSTDNAYRLGQVSKISISNSLATSSCVCRNLNMVVLHAACTQFRIVVDIIMTLASIMLH